MGPLPGVRFTPDGWLVNLYGPDPDAQTFLPAARRIHGPLDPLSAEFRDLEGCPQYLRNERSESLK
ncbi:hypothetical protein [uncultured Deinococcus sp.]|uniref:hypothetical protein n=1 Tax=uncultured Deinococcus sp. TaxID=158789 RepID=UPI0025D51E28|nr:hypothetical protein [uncultured Deinococcus sp.]